MGVWYDGAISGNQLLDRSGNNRHANVTNNIVTNGDASLGNSLRQYNVNKAATLSSINTDAPAGSTHCFEISSAGGAATFSGGDVNAFVVQAGESLNYSFKIKRVTNNVIYWGIRNGNGSTDFYSTNSGATPLALGQWVTISGTASPTISGGRATLYVFCFDATYTVRLGEVSVSPAAETNAAMILPDVAELKSTDTKNHWYLSNGIARSIRSRWEYNAYVNKIYCGGNKRYIFLKNEPSQSTHDIIHYNFEDLDYAWTSCPVRITAGTAGTYTTLPNAIAANTGTATFLHRRYIELLNDENYLTYNDYPVVTAFGRAAIQLSKDFEYVDLGGFKIFGSKAVNSTDSQLTNTELFVIILNGGVRNGQIENENGGYTLHLDFNGMINSHTIFKDLYANQIGGAAIFAYRAANALPMPIQQLAFNTLAGGGWDGYIHKMKNVTLRGMRGFTWQDVSVTSGNGFRGYYNDLILESLPIHDPVSNPTSAVLESIKETSSGGGRNSTIYLSRSIRNSTINEVGAVKSIFLTEG